MMKQFPFSKGQPEWVINLLLEKFNIYRFKEIYQFFNSGEDYDEKWLSQEAFENINGSHKQKIHYTEIQDIHIQPMYQHKLQFTDVTEKDIQPRPKPQRRYPPGGGMGGGRRMMGMGGMGGMFGMGGMHGRMMGGRHGMMGMDDYDDEDDDDDFMGGFGGFGGGGFSKEDQDFQQIKM